MKTIETWFLWLMIYSIIGWVYESTICSIGHRKLINRGFLNGSVLSDLRHGRGAGAARAGQDSEPGAAVFCRRGGDVQSGISDVVADGKAVPRPVVGLLEAEIQHRRRVCLIGAVVFGAFSVVLVLALHRLSRA